jgi:molybdenum cofactor guanylyltransferase
MRAEVITFQRESPGSTDAPPAAAGLTGVVLAGGRSPNFAGVDKALIQVAGRAVLKRVLEQLVLQVSQILIVTNRNPSLYAGYGYRVVPDALPEDQGPLSGIVAGLKAIETSHALFVPADAAKLPPNLAQTLLQAHGQHRAPCVVLGTDRLLPACCLVPKSEHASAEAALLGGQRDPVEWLRSRGAAPVDFRAWPTAFWSLRSPADVPVVEAALRR